VRKHTLLGPLLERKFAERKVIDARLKSPGRPARAVQINQPFGVGHPQIAQHHSVHHAENRGVGANPERQRQHHHRSEAGVFGLAFASRNASPALV